VKIDFLWRPSLKDPEDEMVLETAVNGGADLLLTFNARDFSGAWAFSVEIEQPGPAWRRYGVTRP
jgi:predicted nucleic acid-binding protein